MSEATLFIFPHAGGAPGYYAPFAQMFSTGLRRIAVPYPGRGGTHDVASLSSIEALVDGLWCKLPPERVGDGAVAFFGHSMGALVAFEMARRFAAADRPVDALFVSACAAPGHSGFGVCADSDDALLAAAADMTGIDARMLAHEEFAARFLPTLRGFHAITRYRVPEDVLLHCPIRAYGGSDDRIASRSGMQPWASRTTDEFQLRIFDGHHFYLEDHAADVAADVERCLASTRPPEAPLL